MIIQEQSFQGVKTSLKDVLRGDRKDRATKIINATALKMNRIVTHICQLL
jgi:hypothetical protein